MSGSCPTWPTPLAWLENELSDEEAQLLNVHDADCDACREMAPDSFVRSEEEGYSYVAKQPTTPEEEEQCRDALEGCPVEAIGDNGGA